LYFGKELPSKRCNKPCPGDKKQMCGGEGGASSVYVLIPDMSALPEPPSKWRYTMNYAHRSGQTCGQDPKGLATVGGATTAVASVEDCKGLCRSGAGAHECHGFTYELAASKCTFHRNVFAGDVRADAQATCFWKPS